MGKEEKEKERKYLLEWWHIRLLLEKIDQYKL